MSTFRIILVAVVLVLLVVGGAAGHHVTTTDAFCSSCHAYERASWDHGLHPHTGCLECHTGGFMRDKTQGARKVWLVFTGQVDPHHARLPSYPDKTMANCIECHMTEEAEEQQPFFVERHEDYMQAANYCIACHEPGHNLGVLELRYLSVRRAALRE
jgi:cytochrome c nitrite reductase small subunit